MQIALILIVLITMIVLGFVIARLAERLKKVEKQLTEIVRKQAIDNADR